MITARSRRSPSLAAALRGLAIAAMIAAPSITVLLSVSLVAHSTMLEFRPFLNDEVYYWHQTATAASAGMRGGFYTVEERTTGNAFRFGPHGPLVPLLYGTAARVFGWQRASGPLFNLGWLALCAALFIWLTGLHDRRIWLAAALLATLWPIPFWAASNMQESLHHGIALLLAGALIAMGRRDRAGFVVAALVLPLALLTRLSWGIVVPGVLLLALGQRSVPKILLSGVVAAAIVAAAISIFTSIAPRMPGAFRFLSYRTVQEGLSTTSVNLSDNLRRLADHGDDYDSLEILHRAEYLALTLVIVGAAAAAWRRERAWRSPDTAHLIAQASNLAGIVAAMVLLYALTNWTEHRVISAHLLLAALVLTALPGRFGPTVVALLIAANIAGGLVYISSFRENRHDNFTWDRRSLRVFEETAAIHLRYEPGAQPWCNTLLSAQYPPDFVAVPPGIGISSTRQTDQMAWPPHSRYLLFDPPTLTLIGDRLHARPLASLPYGTLYLNLDADCPPVAAE